MGWYVAVDPHFSGDWSVNRRGKEADKIIGGKIISFYWLHEAVVGSTEAEGRTNATHPATGAFYL
jgi:hypothetical protein